MSLRNILERLESWPGPAILALCLVLTALVAVADYYTGPLLSSAIFYVAPIGIAAWYGSRRLAVVISILGASGWLWADMGTHTLYSNSFYPVWNSLTRLDLFLIIVYFMRAFREELRRHRELAYSDGLTGLANTRAFVQAAAEELRRSRRYAHPFTVAYLDIDNFKHVNDTLGHSAGDTLLIGVARTMREALRNTDHLARLGGDEFALLLPETDADEADETLRKLLVRLNDRMRASIVPVTFSVGLITFRSAPEDVSRMLEFADKLMYEVKRGGKNGYRHEVWAGENLGGPPQPLPV